MAWTVLVFLLLPVLIPAITYKIRILNFRSLKDSEAKPSKFFSKEKIMINRNLSTKSLADQFNPNPREPGYHSNIKKCETVLAITQEHRCSMDQEDYLSENRFS